MKYFAAIVFLHIFYKFIWPCLGFYFQFSNLDDEWLLLRKRFDFLTLLGLLSYSEYLLPVSKPINASDWCLNGAIQWVLLLPSTILKRGLNSVCLPRRETRICNVNWSENISHMLKLRKKKVMVINEIYSHTLLGRKIIEYRCERRWKRSKEFGMSNDNCE